MSNTPIIKYLIRRDGSTDTEEIFADRHTWDGQEGHQVFVFWQGDAEVARIPVGSLRSKPEAIYGVLPPEELSRMRQAHARLTADKLGFQGNL